MTDTHALGDLKKMVRDALQADPNIKALSLAQQLNVKEAQALGAYPQSCCAELDALRAEQLIRELEKLGRAHVVVNSGAAIMETFGEFKNFSTAGPYLNVSSRDLHMHIYVKRIAKIFAVKKPLDVSAEPNCSLQFFNSEGDSAFKVFIHAQIPSRTLGLDQQVKVWEQLQDEYRIGNDES